MVAGHALSDDDLARALASWRERDRSRAIHALDRDAIDTSASSRALVLDLLVRDPRPRARSTGDRPEGPPRDLYTACALLGRVLAEAGASPSLAACTLDGATEALAERSAEAATVVAGDGRISAARASVVEGYMAVVVDQERASARRAWEYPACVVRLPNAELAVAAGYPADDGEALADWAARVALASSRDRARRVWVSGGASARAELTEALGLLGIEVVRDGSEARDDGSEPGPAEARRGLGAWLRGAWLRGRSG